MKKILLLILLLFPLWNKLSGQFFSTKNTSAQLSMKFFHPKIETKANESFFNLLTVKNNSNNTFSGKIKYSLPANWTIIGDIEIDINIPSGDSLNLPVRVGVSNTVIGEVAYSVVASLFDKNNRPLISEYCFINIPRISNIKIVSPKRILYFNNKTGTAKFQYKISNDGNTNEIVQLNFEPNELLSVDGKTLVTPLAYEYSIPPHSDTSFNINVNLNQDILNKDFFKLNINTFTQDSLYKNSLWFNKINNIYNHTIPENNKCAIIELSASNILSQRTSLYSILLKGGILLKHDIDINYFFQKQDLNKKWTDYYDTRAYVDMTTKYFNFHIGTIQNIFNEKTFGLGSIIQLKLNRIKLSGHYLYNDRILQTFYGGNLNFLLSKKINLDLGYSENLIESERVQSKILLSGINFSLKKHHFKIKTYLNNTNYVYPIPFEKQGIAIFGNYSGDFNRLKAFAHAEYGSPEYSGISRGRFILNSNLNLLLNNSSNLNFLYNKADYINSYYLNGIHQPVNKNYSDSYALIYNKPITSYVYLLVGPILKIESFNNPYLTTNPDLFFNTISPRLSVAIRYNKTISKIYFKPTLDFGQVIANSDINNNSLYSQPYYTYNINLNSSFKDYSLFIQYRNGPSGIYGKYLYYLSGFYSKWLFIMPAYNKYFFNNKLNLDIRANYKYDILNQNKYSSLTTQLIFFLKGSWTLRFLNSLSSQSRFDALNNTSIKYSSSYFEASIRKEFNCKQPRFQYYDLKIVFFKDLNGNRKKEKNEPGLQNVLAAIEQNYEIEENKDFVSQKLLTGADGNIEYTNIVNGAYNLKYVLIGDMVGNFNREELTQQFTVDEDKTIYIPYLENNRIVGKVILNRDPLSSLGNIDISNIRVVAEDTQGHSYSALTDKQGNFILYTPVTDHYVVKINNIFYESFDIQQPEYIVKFNGYKQFEVTFVFDEKKKKINFDNQLEIDDLKLDDIKVIRKTTLTGKVRDAISLEPVEAEIKIIDNKTNKVVSRAVSNKLNGNYSISYAAGTHFRVEVLSKGYWEHVENLYIEQVISIQNINKDIMLTKEGANRDEQQKTFIIYNKKEEEFKDNFKQGQQIPINYLNFALKETRLDPKSKPELDRLIDLLNKNKTVNVEIAGYSDDGGNARVEKMMALRRAKEVEKYLILHGLPESRISVKSYGNTRPLVPGSSEKAKAKNRRVEIIVR